MRRERVDVQSAEIRRLPVSLPLAFDSPPASRAADGVLETFVAGECVALHAERALYWPRGRTVTTLS